MREQAAIEDRKMRPKAGLYTNYLSDEGGDKICQKVAEEAGEVIIAAKNHDNGQLISETADLLFYMQTLLTQKGIHLRDVFGEIWRRREKEGNLKKRI